MKVEIKETGKVKERDFPKLMKSKYGDIVLMNSDSTGIVVGSKCHNVGYYSQSWGAEYFTDFEGSITLSND